MPNPFFISSSSLIFHLVKQFCFFFYLVSKFIHILQQSCSTQGCGGQKQNISINLKKVQRALQFLSHLISFLSLSQPTRYSLPFYCICFKLPLAFFILLREKDSQILK